MKDMIKRIREEREGFTLAELLIVVAIIAVLVAIAIPVFNSQLEKSREAVDAANIRAAYAEVVSDAITGKTDTTKTVTLKQTQDGWQNTEFKTELGENMVLTNEPKAGKTATIAYTPDAAKNVTVTFIQS